MSKSSDTKTGNVYILTESGIPYSEDGKKYLIKNMSDKYGLTEIIFHEGKSYNDPKTLIKSIRANVNPYIVVSANPITVIHNENINPVIKILNDNLNKPAWQTLNEVCENI